MKISNDFVFILSAFCSLLCDVFMWISGTHSDGFFYYLAGSIVTVVTAAYYFRAWSKDINNAMVGQHVS